MIYVNEIVPRTHRLRGVLISDTHRAGEPATIIAQEGYFVSEPEKLVLSLHLKNGSIHSLNRASNTYRKVDFGAYSLNLDLQPADSSRKNKLEKEEIPTGELITIAAEMQPERERYPLMVEFHSRFAIPFACIVFGLLGVPLGVYSPRTGRSYGFVVGLIVILLYYILFSFGRNIGSTGVVPPSASIWLPNGLFLILAIYLYRKGAAETSVPLLEHLARITDIVRQKVRFLVEGAEPMDPASLGILEDLNTDSEQILVLKLGIDHTLAKNIITYRQSRGSIKDFEELRTVPGIDDDIFHKIKENTIG
jgi:lipopolysaccharide export system permease protein